MTLDTHIRRRIIVWCQNVASEGSGVQNHTQRLAIAKTMLQSAAPPLGSVDNPMAAAISVVELFLLPSIDDTDDGTIDAQVVIAFYVATMTGAWQS